MVNKKTEGLIIFLFFILLTPSVYAYTTFVGIKLISITGGPNFFPSYYTNISIPAIGYNKVIGPTAEGDYDKWESGEVVFTEAVDLIPGTIYTINILAPKATRYDKPMVGGRYIVCHPSNSLIHDYCVYCKNSYPFVWNDPREYCVEGLATGRCAGIGPGCVCTSIDPSSWYASSHIWCWNETGYHNFSLTFIA
jgi:hypothetical protein